MTYMPRQTRLEASAGFEARKLYENDLMCCSEAVLWIINREFNGGLSQKQAVALAKGFCGGIGDAGCVCGALAGAVNALSLVLCQQISSPDDDYVRSRSKELHDRFLKIHGSACCRILSRERDHSSDSKGVCLEYVESAVFICVQIIQEALSQHNNRKSCTNPGKTAAADLSALAQTQS